MEPLSSLKRSAYHGAFKLKVVEYAEANNNCTAAREFCINENQVREWQKNKILNDMPRSKKKCPRCASFPELEKDLNKTEICLCALQMSKDDKYKSVKLSMFVASAGWCTRFMNHHGLCLHQRTKIDAWVSIPLEMIEKSFRKCCISSTLDGSEDDAIFDDDTTGADDEKESESKDNTDDIYDDSAGATVAKAEFNELFGESETDSDF
uniref:Brinker DNA-binding domain-containing protein n=1 Tax=Chelydra serpentina TaxID=8475 RepID=A0A8C3SFD8_CHESE